MAPTPDEVIAELKKKIETLEDKVREYESKALGDNGGSSASSKSMRMVLMGPPGAGKLPVEYLQLNSDSSVIGKGTQAPNIKDKYCVCHLV